MFGMSSREIEFWKIPRRDVQIFGEIGSGAWGAVAKGIFRGQEVFFLCVLKFFLWQGCTR